MDSTTGRDLLRRLREEGFTVQADAGRLLVSPASHLTEDLRAGVKDAKPEILAALRREYIEHVLDLVPVDPETGIPNLPTDQPATERQVERLRELAAHPAFGDHRERVREIVDRALARGLSQLGAYGLLGDLGRRIMERKRDEVPA